MSLFSIVMDQWLDGVGDWVGPVSGLLLEHLGAVGMVEARHSVYL